MLKRRLILVEMKRPFFTETETGNGKTWNGPPNDRLLVMTPNVSVTFCYDDVVAFFPLCLLAFQFQRPVFLVRCVV